MPKSFVPRNEIGKRLGAVSMFGRILLDSNWNSSPHTASFSFDYELASTIGANQTIVGLSVSVKFEVKNGDISAGKIDVCQRNISPITLGLITYLPEVYYLCDPSTTPSFFKCTTIPCK